jgi:penicillin-binding protein-related factor A (putative recombinase)
MWMVLSFRLNNITAHLIANFKTFNSVAGMSSYIIRHHEGLGLYALRRKGLNETLEIYVSAEM